MRRAGFTCYDSAEKIDVCKKPYVVVYDSGIEVQPGTKGMLGRQVYEVVCMVPFEDTEGLEPMAKTVRDIVRSGFPALRLSAATGTGIEETLKGRARSMTYAMCVRIF